MSQASQAVRSQGDFWFLRIIAIWATKKRFFMLFLQILGHFWSSVITSVTFSSKLVLTLKKPKEIQINAFFFKFRNKKNRKIKIQKSKLFWKIHKTSKENPKNLIKTQRNWKMLKNFNKFESLKTKVFRTQETKNHLTDADSSTDTKKILLVRQKLPLFLRGNFELFMSTSFHIWDQFFPLVFPRDSKNL